MELKGVAKQRGRRGAQAGFTLLELVIVLVIIGILAARIIPSFTGRTEEAKVAKVRLDIENISTALELFEADNGFFPTTEQGLAALYEPPTQAPFAENWNGPYLRRQIGADPWGQDYQYICPGEINTNSFDLFSFGPNGQKGGVDLEGTINNWDAQ